MAFKQRISYSAIRMSSRRFPFRRGADVGRIVAISDENDFAIHVRSEREPLTHWCLNVASLSPGVSATAEDWRVNLVAMTSQAMQMSETIVATNRARHTY
jgi:hypothetical protein